ncbi:regulatory protein RecX [Flavobacterium sp. MK4S-17]|uniref:regulatory protein RecX n=1 Tax=Flavobacterium sp. MK4S-17 TaxID=2543737 RepID=UPI00135A736F|nr:regulatory protein RecX [Flavobacterium sp. MK4S-17]
MHKSYTVEEARKKLEQYCAYQERCHEEVVQKLKSLNMIPQAIDVIIAYLIEHNFLNEERFAKSFARGKHRIKHWGRVRIINELKARKISRYNIDAALKELNEDEYLKAFNDLAERFWESAKESNLMKKKKKTFEFLMRKGYEYNLITSKLERF